MIVFNKKSDLAKYIESQKQIGKNIGFVPTMGCITSRSYFSYTTI
jgi:pantothenate synthetase